MSRRKLWLFRCGTMCLGTFVALGMSYLVYPGEIAHLLDNAPGRPVYLQEPGHQRTGHRYLYDQKLGWKNIPHWIATTKYRRLTINSKGLRDREHAYEKAKHVRRILVLGDSFAWGYGVADHEVFTEILEDELRRRPLSSQHSYEVINTGVSGWGTDQEFLFLQQEGFRYAPDVVVLAFFLVNDVTNNGHSMQYGMHKPLFLNRELELTNVPVPGPFEKRKPQKSEVDPLDVTLALIERMDAECARHDCRLVVMKFGRFLPEHQDNPELIRYERQLEVDLIDRLEIPYLDLDAQFAARQVSAEALLEGNDDGHWNAEGHRLVAELLHAFLLQIRRNTTSEIRVVD